VEHVKEMDSLVRLTNHFRAQGVLSACFAGLRTLGCKLTLKSAGVQILEGDITIDEAELLASGDTILNSPTAANSDHVPGRRKLKAKIAVPAAVIKKCATCGKEQKRLSGDGVNCRKCAKAKKAAPAPLS
jgi:hypothetical protein